MRLAMLEVLSDTEIRDIHEATVDILENCGVQVLHKEMLDFLAQKGLAVDKAKGRVRFSRSVIEDSLATIPHRFEVFNREGEFACVLGDGYSKIAAGHNAIFWVDADTGETRPSHVADVEQFARLCDALEAIHIVGIPVMPQDTPNPVLSLLAGVDACIRNTTKPIYFSTDNLAVNRAIIEMLRAVFKGDFDTQVYGISQLSPTSPLYWEGGVISAIMDTVKTAVPLALLPEPIAGISAPYTLAGLLTVDNAECISGLVMTQLLKPGHPMMYANSWTCTDMRSGAALVGSTETTICRIAGAQLARFYGVPSHTTAPNSDNHAHDEQNAWEKTFSTFCSVGAGNDLIVNCGMFATGMTCSNEQLIMDEEISAMALRIAEGVRVNDDTLPVDLIKELGPKGDYLTAPHTMKWLRSDEYLKPRVTVRGPYASWVAEGSKDSYELSKERVQQMEAKGIGSPLDPERAAALAEVLAVFAGPA